LISTRTGTQLDPTTPVRKYLKIFAFPFVSNVAAVVVVDGVVVVGATADDVVDKFVQKNNSNSFS
jgi:hypothetical protein